MVKSLKIEKEIKKIDKDIKKLKTKKKKLSRQIGIVYCPICKKFYPEKECRIGIEFKGEITCGFPAACPKGHEWDDKD